MSSGIEIRGKAWLTMQQLRYGLSIQSWPSGHALDSEEAIEFTELKNIDCMIEKFPLARANDAFCISSYSHLQNFPRLTCLHSCNVERYCAFQSCNYHGVNRLSRLWSGWGPPWQACFAILWRILVELRERSLEKCSWRLAPEKLICHKNIIQAIVSFQINLLGRPQKRYKSIKPRDPRRVANK